MSKNDRFELECLYESLYQDSGVKGLGEFLYKLTDIHHTLIPHLKVIKDFIVNSGCPEIKIMPLKMGLGAALKSYVLISPTMLNQSLENCLYGLFHEIAHQYQYKKYKNKIAEMFLNDNDTKLNAKFLEKIELVADNFSLKKCRSLAKMGILNMESIRKVGMYSTFSSNQFEFYLNSFRDVLKKKNITNVEEVGDVFYEYITGEKLKKIEQTK
jgi:hypothetical protein